MMDYRTLEKQEEPSEEKAFWCWVEEKEKKMQHLGELGFSTKEAIQLMKLYTLERIEEKAQRGGLERMVEALEDMAGNLQLIQSSLENIEEMTECIIDANGRKYLSVTGLISTT